MSRAKHLSRSISRRLVLAVVGATATGWAAAWGVSAALEPALAPPELAAAINAPPEALADIRHPPPPRLDRPRRLSKSHYVRPILERSIFDSTKVGATQREADSDGQIEPTDLDLVLVSTMVAIPADYSSAWIGREDTKRVRRKRKGRRRGTRRVRVRTIEEAAGYGIGDAIGEHDATVVAIEQGRVTIQRGDGSLEYLLLFEETEESGGDDEPARRGGDDEDEDGVERVSRYHYRVDREVIDKLAESPAALARLGRAVPHKDSSGEVDGYRLSGLRRKSIGRKIGLRNGDIIHEINGHRLTSMNEALSAWDDLQGASDLDVRITRRNKPQTLKVEVN